METVEEKSQGIMVQQTESIKLVKMSKGFNWEVKLVGNVDDIQLERLKQINAKMEVEYGSSG